MMKKIVKNYLAISGALALLLIVVQPGFLVQGAKSLLQHCGISVTESTEEKKSARNHFKNYLKQQEDTAWKELEKSGITRNKFEQAKSELQEEFHALDTPPADSQPVSAETESIIKEVLKEFGRNADDISIVSHDIQAPIAASDKILFVNEKIFNQFSLESQRFVIAHEIQHMLHQDTATTFTINKLRNNDEPITDPDHPVNRFSRFREERADIETALTSKHWAENYETFAKEVTQKWGDTDDPTHPKNSERLALAHNIVNQMNKETIV